MKKATSLIWILIWISGGVSAQKEYENNWILGYGVSNDNWKYHIGGMRVHFEGGEPVVDTMNVGPSDTFVTTMSDEAGELIFYSNGCSIFNSNYQVMDSGNHLNPGEVYDSYCDSEEDGTSYYPNFNLIISFPRPSHPGQYEVFHVAAEDGTYLSKTLYQTSIDMNEPGGLGKITAKNKELFSKTIVADVLAACRHGNGRDWWILMPMVGEKTIYRFLLTPDTTLGPYAQQVGYDKKPYVLTPGQCCFSPDGKHYVHADPGNGVNLYDFDACTGLLSNAQRYYYAPDTAFCSGAAFSPNSRFLYVSTGVKLYQYDMWSPDIGASRIVIDDVNANPAPSPASIFVGRLAINDKIYFSSTGTIGYLHVINKPDEAGKACDFVQQGYELPRLNDWIVPNIPYFRLFDQPGSPCDTLGIDAPISTKYVTAKSIISVFPNPVSSTLSIDVEQAGYGSVREQTVDITDLLGRRLYTVDIDYDGHAEIDTQALPPGMYIAVLRTDGHQVQAVKFVVVRSER
ncbi:MAG TPA: T9SS type A sorting domain-containing protein [Saprospiraceae bacterium]|nr:T9SS type A sorting domain-containing protein [Saprospiraceae bacterium]HNG05787.1 T9SS type A sorting domain-containing protein [Saprospiraceae bacterium]HNG13906.1 T9SS type A sorting domain-containing protein [Saprospiraceae bacterium]